MTATKRSAALLGRLRGGDGTHSQPAILADVRRVLEAGGVPPGAPVLVDNRPLSDDTPGATPPGRDGP